MLITAIWHGTQAEAFELAEAIKRNCQCSIIKPCSLHMAFASDQRWLDGLVAERRRVDELRRQECMLPPAVE